MKEEQQFLHSLNHTRGGLQTSQSYSRYHNEQPHTGETRKNFRL